MPRRARQHRGAAHHGRPAKHGVEAVQANDAEPGARAFWSGTLSFGLVSIPVELHAATRPRGASLRMLAPDGTPLVRRYYCPEDNRPVPDEELVRGFEHEPDDFVVVADDELAALAPEKSRDIDLERFVAAGAIPPPHFERGYVLAPAGGSVKAYRLLAWVMEQRAVAGIATFVLHDHEHVVAILSDRGLLRAETLRFVEELRSRDGLGIPSAKAADADETRAFAKVIATLAASRFDPAKIEDPGAEPLRELAERKHRRGTDVIVREVEGESASAGADVIDLMEVLKKSLGKSKAAPRRPRAH